MRHVRRCRDDEAATILAIINSRHACIATPFRPTGGTSRT